MGTHSTGFTAAPGGRRQPLTEINMIPLIDVMLVLLIVFMITAPLLTHAVHIELPKASSQPDPAKPEQLDLALKADGSLWWQDQAISSDELEQRLQAAAAQQPPPALRLRAEAQTPYEQIARVMAAATRAGLPRLGFASTPEGR